MEGAIRAHGNSSFNIYRSIFRNNKALDADGGAIILKEESQLQSDRCQFIDNTAALGGGAVMVIDHSSYTDKRSIFTHNIAVDNGRFSFILPISIMFICIYM